jgi:hypothetical protein
VTAFADGAALLLGLLLASAGALKVVSPRAFEHALYRLLPARFDSVQLVRVAARAIGATEVVVGGCLLAVPWASNRFAVAPAAAGAVLYFGFVGVIAVAVRKGTACGCFSSFSDSVAGGAELGRSVALAALALALLSVELVGPATGWRWTALAWLAGLTVGVAAVAMLGGRLRPELERRQRVGRMASLLLGRVRSDNASKPLRGLSVPRRQQVSVARAVRSSQSWATVVEWLGDRAATVRWNGAFAQERHVSEGPEGRSGHYVLAPLLGSGIHLIATVRAENGVFTDCLLLGKVDDKPVSVAEQVVMSGTTPVFVSRDAPAASPAAGTASC